MCRPAVKPELSLNKIRIRFHLSGNKYSGRLRLRTTGMCIAGRAIVQIGHIFHAIGHHRIADGRAKINLAQPLKQPIAGGRNCTKSIAIVTVPAGRKAGYSG